MKKLILFSALLATLSISALAQGVREPAAQPSASQTPTSNTNAATVDSPNAARPADAPPSFAARYEGGMFGYSNKIKGTMHFDDVNKRLVFRDKDAKEVLSLPHKSILVIEASSRKYTPTGANVAKNIPLPGAGLLGFISSKHRYLAIQFSDPDSNVTGGANFKVANKELLRSIIYSLGEKAELKQRGDAFYRPRESAKPVL